MATVASDPVTVQPGAPPLEEALESIPGAVNIAGGTPRPSHAVRRDEEAGAAPAFLAQYPAPTEEEKSTLRRVAGPIPKLTFVLCIVELAERASFYGAKTVFNNYLQFPLPEGGDGTGAIDPSKPNQTAGALNQGLQLASALTLLFSFLTYVVPLFGAWLGDSKYGRMKTILLGVLIGGFAHVIMVGGAAPSVLKAGNGLAPFLVSFFLLSLGAGIFKPNVAPTVLDQYEHQYEYTVTKKSGEKVIIDPERTIQRIMLIFYAMVNVGAFFMLATTYTEKYVGFWVAFLEPTILYLLLPLILALIYKRTIKKPPMGSELTEFVKISWTSLKANKFRVWSKDYWANARSSKLAEKGVHVTWSDKAVDDARRTYSACLIFLYFPVYYLNDGGVGAASSNQGAAMTTNGAPNDLLNNFNPIVIIAFTPFMTYVVYPFLSRRHIRFGPIARMTFGFVIAAISSIIGGIVQYRVYETSPCGYSASTCEIGVSPISIWWQIPNVALGAMSEIFTNVTAYEMAYVRAPPHMKAVVMALFLFNNALSSALGEILIPAIVDPNLVWAWCAPGIALFVQTAIFWFRHRHVDSEAYITHDADSDSEAIVEKQLETEKAAPVPTLQDRIDEDGPQTETQPAPR